ncbi:MAG: sigma-54-dependent Fis family transcriptional regulator [Planctomycetota bacterium]|nr:sigma-54-dependent Fis family transcriptional regulator [Planctomycetota bacterium]
MTSHFLSELLSFLDGLPEPRIVMDADYRIVAANAAYAREFGAGKEVAGRRCYEVSHHFDVPCDQAGESCPLKQSLEDGAPQRVLHLHHTPRGEEYVDIELSPVRDAAGEIAWFIEKMEPLHVARGVSDRRGLIGRSPAFQRMLELIARVAPSDASVLLQGESGTGKELVARALHRNDAKRKKKRFYAQNCGAITESLLESLLFGHERGAFTGADRRKQGLFEIASGSTLFLDEIGEMSLDMQTKLLRVLQEREVVPLGASEPVKVDVRIVAATLRDLDADVAAGRFRQDLYHRLKVVRIDLPPLRERPEDVPLLVDHFLKKVARERGARPKVLDRRDERILQVLTRYPWPGNIRQLENVVTKLAYLAGDVITYEALAEDKQLLGEPEAEQAPTRPPRSLDAVVEEVERAEIDNALKLTRGNRSRAAALLQINRRSLLRRLQKYGYAADDEEDDGQDGA